MTASVEPYSGSYLPDFLENATSLSTAELSRLSVSSPGDLLPLRDSVLSAYESTWLRVDPSQLPAQQEGELRPLYGKGLVSAHETLSSHYVSGGGRGAIGRDVKALLLYAHELVVLNPLADWPVFNSGTLRSAGPPAGMAFIRALGGIAEIANLIRSGVVLVVDPPTDVDVADIDATAAIAEAAHAMRDRVDRFDQWDQFAGVEDAIYRLLIISLLDSKSLQPTTIFANRQMEGDGLGVLLRSLASSLGSRDNLPRTDPRLAALFRLSLPGVDGLSAADMITVRDHNLFGRFRVDLRQAVAAVESHLAAGDDVAARTEVTEYMRARAGELKTSSLRSRLFENLSGAAISYTVGSATSSFDHWQSAVLALLAQGTFDTARQRARRSEKALLRHYIALSAATGSSNSGSSTLDRIRDRRRGSPDG